MKTAANVEQIPVTATGNIMKPQMHTNIATSLQARELLVPRAVVVGAGVVGAKIAPGGVAETQSWELAA